MGQTCASEREKWRFCRIWRGIGDAVHGDCGFPCDDVVHRGFHCRRYVGRPDVDGFRGFERPGVGCGFRAARQLVWADACVECAAGKSDANVCFGTSPVLVG